MQIWQWPSNFSCWSGNELTKFRISGDPFYKTVTISNEVYLFYGFGFLPSAHFNYNFWICTLFWTPCKVIPMMTIKHYVCLYITLLKIGNTCKPIQMARLSLAISSCLPMIAKKYLLALSHRTKLIFDIGVRDPPTRCLIWAGLFPLWYGSNCYLNAK